MAGGGGLGAALTPWLARHSALWHHARTVGSSRHRSAARLVVGQPRDLPGNIRPHLGSAGPFPPPPRDARAVPV